MLLVSFVPEGTWTVQALPPVYSAEPYRRMFADAEQLRPVLNSLKMQAGVSDVHRATIAEAEQVATLEWKAPAKQKVPA